MKGTIHVFDLLNQHGTDLPQGICALFGSERFLKLLALNHLISLAADGEEDFSETRFEGESASWADVIDEISTRSLFGGDGPRVVVVDHADKFVKLNRERLEDFVNQNSSSGLLILLVDTWASNTRLYKAIDKKACQVRCEAPTKSSRSKKADPQKISKWLIQRAKSEYDFVLPSAAAMLLIDATESEFGRMDQELQKLALYADDSGKIEMDTIKSIVGGWRARTMWEAIDAAVSGNAGKALELLDQLIRSGEHPLALFGQLSWSLRRYSVAADIVFRQVRNGTRPDMGAAAKQAGFQSWNGEIEKSQANLKQLGRERANKISSWLVESDFQLKRSHSQNDRGRLVLENLIVKMAKELAPKR
ncbi:MAG: DNA polymerase III subunit delta [Planctomycetota bacterium]